MELWFTEDQTDHLRLSVRVREVLHRARSPYQAVAVYETEAFGRLLALDDVIMTTERDEFVYHELMAHVPLVTHPRPQRVCIVGGGDGGVLREVLKHPGVTADLVEIDAKVVEVSRRFLPSIATRFDDPRARVLYEDGIVHMARCEAAYDVVIVDSTDPVGPAVGLFGEDFYRSVYRALRDDGCFVAQTESPFFNQDLIRRVQATLRAIFPVVRLYWGVVPTYPGGFWTFSFASKGPDPLTAPLERAARLGTRWYSAAVHRAAFVLPPFVEALVAP
ncbi:MAG: polyamine aminopropyltransferase [Clostridia bacterium]|nr:polyamine aminopropyltransferase [Clostridia bacterium]